jgi:hypothetical protein
MAGEQVPAAHRAIQLAKQGQLPGKDLLAQLVAGRISVPVSQAPRIDNGKVSDWSPVTATKADGSQWLLAYTLPALASAYCERNPEHGLYVTVDTRWVLQAMPTGHGIVFNLETPEMFQWNAVGVVKYLKDVLGWNPG